MKLEELRQQLDTDARQRCEAQEKTIRDLIAQNKELQGLLRERDDDIRALQNRCFAMTHGGLCLFCGMRRRCKRTVRATQAGEGERDGA